MLRRKTPLRRSGWLRRRAPIRRVSPARRADFDLAAAARRLVIERDRHCVMCREPISDVHHRLPRGAGGALGDPTRWAQSRLVGLCREHHRWVEEYRSFASVLGLLVPRGLTAPAEVPVFHHKRWVLLDDHGCVLPCPQPSVEIPPAHGSLPGHSGCGEATVISAGYQVCAACLGRLP